ncbi:MAG: NRDE family protein [Acidobacteria bacterium]|jgi:uncharacterized protein with NRDE domain|nr:MAG: NRDE family protein [Acidobacteriota bacterium]GIU82487.1 MAG: hypothetical protein KatS3mg006_1551 [Pyrinomonadaceae bacterium]
MCLLVFAYRMHPEYEFIFAGNRDEFYSRPSEVAKFWEENPDVLAGRDLVHGGTWLGITRSGRFATVTNYRQPGQKEGKRSRGRLVSDFLMTQKSPKEYLEDICASDYTGFNLLVGDFLASEIAYFSNREDNLGAFRILQSGIYGLSNHLLDTEWHKVKRAKAFLEKALQRKEICPDELFRFLEDRTQADESSLPNTGIGIELEKLLSPIFVETPIYGTRCSTVILLKKSGKLTFIERNHQLKQEQKFTFMLDSSKSRSCNLKNSCF